MTFVDTSAIYALADRGDPNHELARDAFALLLERGEELLTHNYVLVESVAILQRRLGLEPALRFAEETRHFVVDWVGAELHHEAVRALMRHGRRGVSLVDQVSFLVMRARRTRTAFAFDQDFAAEGFALVPEVPGAPHRPGRPR